MSKPQAIAPFLLAPVESVACMPWMMREPRSEVLAAVFPEWDSATDIRLSRNIRVDVKGIWAACGLATDDRISVGVEWISEGTSLRGTMVAPSLGYGGEVEQSVEVHCRGSELGQALLLRTRLILASAKGTSESRVSPRLHGSILWKDECRVALEGEGSRFPMEAIDFEHLAGVSQKASWHLSWMPHEPDLPLTAALRLHLNIRHKGVIAALVSAIPTEAEQVIRRVILWDVARRIVKGMLENPEFSGDKGGYAPGSLGQAATSLIATHLSGETIAGLRSLNRAQPEIFESLLQGAFRATGGEEA